MTRESKLIVAYRAVLRGVTNGECIHKLGLGAVYRTRISDVRLAMEEKFGPHPAGDWCPGVMVFRSKEKTIVRWELIIPDGANPADPLLWLPETEKGEKKLDAAKRGALDCAQTLLF